MTRTAVLLFLLSAAAIASAATYTTGGPVTTDNDASCDIAAMPAATLLLPYFEVDLNAPVGTGETTIFTITNHVNLPQNATVTLWTDWGYPVLSFNIFLTGYDVQSINLYDVIGRGLIAPDDGSGFDVSPVGELSGNTSTQKTRDNPLLNESSCVDLPVFLPQVYIKRMQSSFTTGIATATSASATCNTAGGVHANAIGYATIDVTGQCTTLMPIDPEYFSENIRFDNVLSGDYVQVNGSEDYAQGNPLVHIRAIPEGGTPGTRADNPQYEVHSPQTFYSRFQSSARPRFDARQPLPAVFSARWISGGAGGFETFYKIWREGRATRTTVCSSLPAANAAIPIVELVRFDEEENPETLPPPIILPEPILFDAYLPAVSRTKVDDWSIYPPNTGDSAAGWMYLNLDPLDGDAVAGQNWVVVSMRAEGRYSVDMDAIVLGNGCSKPVRASEATSTNGQPIAPAPNIRP